MPWALVVLLSLILSAPAAGPLWAAGSSSSSSPAGGVATAPQPASSSSTSAAAAPLVLFDHDGGVDDFITLLLLLSRPDKARIIGITILDGDCYADVAANTTIKLLHLLKQPDTPVAVSTLPAVSPFPAAYRSQGLILDVLPILNRHSPADLAALHNRHLQQVPGQEVFAQLLLQQTDKVTIVATGPLSNLAYALDTYPQLADRIQQVWWMGGALRVRGNVYEPGSDGSAEWNAYWDPAALASVWRSSVPLTLVPLDGTNKVPITPDLVYSFGPQADYLFSALAGTFYAPVVNWVYSTPGDPYYAWDALTAACMMDPPLCKVETDLAVAAVLSGPAQGATVLAGEEQGRTSEADTQQHLRKGAGPTQAAGDPGQVYSTQDERHTTPSLLSRIQRVLLGRPAGSLQTVGVPAAETGAGSGGSQALAAGAGLAAGHDGGGSVSSVQGTDVSKPLSTVKRVSAVMDVDAQEFHQYILKTLRT